ncbi:MAG: hypothetical protein WCV67_03050 [Victivallaceae bacterium]|jgi:hypothetical protein
MNKNWTVKDGVLYRQTHNHDGLGTAVGSVKHLDEKQIAEITKTANLEKTIKAKIAKAKELIKQGPENSRIEVRECVYIDHAHEDYQRVYIIKIDGLPWQVGEVKIPLEPEDIPEDIEDGIHPGDTDVYDNYAAFNNAQWRGEVAAKVKLNLDRWRDAVEGTELIKATGMKLDALAEYLGVSLDTVKSYSIGRLPVLPESKVKLQKIIKQIKG